MGGSGEPGAGGLGRWIRYDIHEDQARNSFLQVSVIEGENGSQAAE